MFLNVEQLLFKFLKFQFIQHKKTKAYFDLSIHSSEVLEIIFSITNSKYNIDFKLFSIHMLIIFNKKKKKEFSL